MRGKIGVSATLLLILTAVLATAPVMASKSGNFNPPGNAVANGDFSEPVLDTVSGSILSYGRWAATFYPEYGTVNFTFTVIDGRTCLLVDARNYQSIILIAQKLYNVKVNVTTRVHAALKVLTYPERFLYASTFQLDLSVLLLLTAKKEGIIMAKSAVMRSSSTPTTVLFSVHSLSGSTMTPT